MEISRDHATLHLSEQYGDGSSAAKLFIEGDDIGALCRELRNRPNAYMNPAIEATDWGCRRLTIVDTFDNRVVFSETVTSAHKDDRSYEETAMIWMIS